MESGVAKFRGSLPSTKDLERLQAQAPGLFDSGYFVLSAVDGARPADRNQATFAVNLARGGNAGQITVIPKRASSTESTQRLGEDLANRTQAFARADRHDGRARRTRPASLRTSRAPSAPTSGPL